LHCAPIVSVPSRLDEQETTHMWLSNAANVWSKTMFPSGLSSVTVLAGATSGKAAFCTPPMVCPHATSCIISVGVKPMRANAAV
jgi:hypothetical protein